MQTLTAAETDLKKGAGADLDQPVANGSTSDDSDADESRLRLAAIWWRSPPWLVSAIFHALVMLVLGLCAIEAAETTKETSLTSSLDPPEEMEELEDVLLDEPLEDLSDLPEAIPFDVDDPGMAAFGQLPGLDADLLGDVGDLAIRSATDEVGTLFGRDGHGFASSGDGKGGATFFGVKAGGKRFVFVVDGSQSMRRNGWDYCKLELLSAVRRLKPNQYFYVILFASDAHRMFDDENPQEVLLRASEENFAKLERWLYTYDLEWGTKPLESMKFALKLRPDAIYFLTDGKIQDDTDGYLQKNNKREDAYGDTVAGSAVHTIGFFQQDGQPVLDKISKENGGTYRFVPTPPGYRPPPLQPRNKPADKPDNKKPQDQPGGQAAKKNA
ncbi:MAG TPA: VWA domain-containing protein [Thermoguttaceae bacterium]|nr:VWA domain-containing protein [Thermoguttaceae bacterium]